MSDDLVKRLRYVAGRVSDMDDHIDVHLGADRIEELEARLATCEKYRDAYAECDRIATEAVRDLEARLEKVEGALEHAKQNMPHPDQLIDDALADLKDHPK